MSTYLMCVSSYDVTNCKFVCFGAGSRLASSSKLEGLSESRAAATLRLSGISLPGLTLLPLGPVYWDDIGSGGGLLFFRADVLLVQQRMAQKDFFGSVP